MAASNDSVSVGIPSFLPRGGARSGMNPLLTLRGALDGIQPHPPARPRAPTSTSSPRTFGARRRNSAGMIQWQRELAIDDGPRELRRRSRRNGDRRGRIRAAARKPRPVATLRLAVLPLVDGGTQRLQPLEYRGLCLS